MIIIIDAYNPKKFRSNLYRISASTILLFLYYQNIPLFYQYSLLLSKYCIRNSRVLFILYIYNTNIIKKLYQNNISVIACKDNIKSFIVREILSLTTINLLYFIMIVIIIYFT